MERTGIKRLLGMVVLLSGSPAQTLLFAALGPALPLLAAHFGESANSGFVAQILMTMPALGIILGGAVCGFVIARLGVRTTLYGALTVYALAGAGGLYLDNVASLMASRFALGFAVAHYAPCVLILLADQFNEEARARLLGYQGAVSGVTSVSAIMAAGALTEWGGWRAPFSIYLVALIVLACALVTVRTPVQAQPTASVTEKASVRALWPIYGVIILLYIGVLMTSIQLSFLLAADGVTNAFSRSWIMAMGSVGSTVSGGAFGFVLARLGARPTRTILAGMMGLGFIVIGIGGGVLPVAVGCLMSGLGAGMSTPYLSNLLLSRASPQARGRALGFMYTSVYLADFVNPLIIAPIRAAVGIHGAFLAVGTAFFAAAIGMALYRTRGASPVLVERTGA